MTQTSKKWRFMLTINYLSSSFIFFRYSLSRKIHFNRFSSLKKIITTGQILKHLYAIVNNKGIVQKQNPDQDPDYGHEQKRTPYKTGQFEKPDLKALKCYHLPHVI